MGNGPSESVVVMDDWWSIPEDAVHRAEALIEMALGQKRTFAVEHKLEEPAREILRPQMPDLIGARL